MMENEEKGIAARDAEMTEELIALSKKHAKDAKAHFDAVTRNIRGELEKLRLEMRMQTIKVAKERL